MSEAIADNAETRYAHLRPGLDLIAVEDAALPATLVYADVLAQERKGLPLLSEFVLRFCGAGISTPQGISEVCGLELALVETAIADCVSSGDLSHSPETGRIGLTPQGLRTQDLLESVQPVEKRIPIVFDRLTWQISDLPQRELLNRRDCVDLGYTLLPPSRTAKIAPKDVTISEINGLLRRQRSGRAARIEILKLRKLAANTHRYLPCKLLVFGSQDAEDAEISLVVDQRVSSPHDLAVAALGGPKALGLRVGHASPRPVLDDELESKRTESSGSMSAGDQNASEFVRGISVLEHREQLEIALTNARSRLLIISPWVRSAVVNRNFLRNLETRLRSGCVVTIAHGIGKDDSGSDPRALDALTDLQAKYSKFTFSRLENTHAKVLVYDDTWISTSFNWLSFRGDPDRTYRMEEGTLVRIKARVDAEYSRYVDLISRQSVAN